MTQNKSNHLPPEQSKNLPIKIDTEYVWIRINKKWELSSYKSLDAYIKLGMSNKLLPAPTLEEMLSVLPDEVKDNGELCFLGLDNWHIYYATEADYMIQEFIMNKDPKQAVDQMLHWLFENNYLKELTNAK